MRNKRKAQVRSRHTKPKGNTSINTKATPPQEGSTQHQTEVGKNTEQKEQNPETSGESGERKLADSANKKEMQKKYGCKIPGKKPQRIKNKTYEPTSPGQIRFQLRIMTLCVGSFYGHKKVSECFLNDHQVHVAVVIEPNII